jgi:hypothetical protein
MTTRAELEQRLTEIEIELKEIRQRLPAHSAKPPIMMALFALEDEREELLSRLKSMPQRQGDANKEITTRNTSKKERT